MATWVLAAGKGSREKPADASLISRCREAEGEGSALAFLAADLDGASVTLGTVLHDGQAQARAAGFLRSALLQTVETLEDLLALGLGNAGAVVGHQHGNAL